MVVTPPPGPGPAKLDPRDPTTTTTTTTATTAPPPLQTHTGRASGKVSSTTKDLPRQEGRERDLRLSGHWKVKPFYTNYPPQLLLIWFWSAFLCQDWLIRSLFSSSTAACLMRWWLDGVRTRPDQDINQSFLVGNPSSPHGNTIFSSSNKVSSLVLIRITPVSPPYKSDLVSAGSNKWNKSHHKDANQAWKALLLGLYLTQ